MQLLGINMSFEEFDKLMCEQSNGKELKLINNKVMAVERVFTEVDQLYQLRQLRNSECFSVINRGLLWYNTLNNSQLDELTNWYINWLDVTKTKIVPVKPSWIK
ncbi:MAG: hypothetical protein IJD48_01065 [Clostridia bacterium]|nr:hypothetical protein [Clostridia bacterium]